MKTTQKQAPRKVAMSAGPLRRQQPSQFSRATLHIKKVLVPIDFSEYSRRALAYAVGLARSAGADLVLLHVVESFPLDRLLSPETIASDNKARVQGAKNELEGLGDAFGNHRRTKKQPLVSVGKPSQKIIETARDVGADVIVLGSHGYTGIQRMYLGSTAERVVRHAPCHVLVVRE